MDQHNRFETVNALVESAKEVIEALNALQAIITRGPEAAGAELVRQNSEETLVRARALIARLSPELSEDKRLRFQAQLSHLEQMLESVLPPSAAQASLVPVADALKAAWEDLESESVRPSRPLPVPQRPGAGLPSRGSGPLFPEK